MFARQLSVKETRELQRLSARLIRQLREVGLTEQQIGEILQRNLFDVYERRSILCPYETLRAQTWVLQSLAPEFTLGHNLNFVSLGRPQDRIAVGNLEHFDPKNLFRQYQRGLAALKKIGIETPRAFCVMEVQLCRPFGSDEFYEPHLHFVIQGPSPDQLRKAFQIRKLSSSKVRKRSLKVLPVHKIRGVLGYMTKLRPEVTFQYKMPDKSNRHWQDNRLPADYLPEWQLFMSRFKAHEVLKFTGTNRLELGQARQAELLPA